MFHHIYPLTQIDHSVIKAIFHFLNTNTKNLVTVIPFEKKLSNLKAKIESNFIKKKQQEVKNLFAAHWTNIALVEYFIKQYFSEYEFQLYAILEKVQNHFKSVPCNHKGIVDFPVNDPAYFEELSILLIPSGQENDPRFMLAAKAIILFFFKSGEFGRRTINDPPSLFTKFDELDNSL